MSCLRPLRVEWPRSERGLPIVDSGVNASSAPGARQSPMMPLQGTGRPFLRHRRRPSSNGFRRGNTGRRDSQVEPTWDPPKRSSHRDARAGAPAHGEMGITRIADVTGLDRIGVPVVMVVRPNSRSVAVSQGKGLDIGAAKASGLMESVEGYHAELMTLPLKFCSYAELRDTHPLADVMPLLPPRRRACSTRSPLLWIEGFDLLNDEPVWVPYELVHTTTPSPSGRRQRQLRRPPTGWPRATTCWRRSATASARSWSATPPRSNPC